MVCKSIQVGGATVGLEARAQLDAAVAHQASFAAAAVQRQSHSGTPACLAPGAVHLAALRALLASVLAPCRHAPPFLPHALHLFCQVRATCSWYLDWCLGGIGLWRSCSDNSRGFPPLQARSSECWVMGIAGT